MSITDGECQGFDSISLEALDRYIEDVAKRNVERTVGEIVDRSHALRRAIDKSDLLVIGAMYNVQTGVIDFFAEKDDHTPASEMLGNTNIDP